MSATIPFGKSFSDPRDLVRLLKSRGLAIEDDSKAQPIPTSMDSLRDIAIRCNHKYIWQHQEQEVKKAYFTGQNTLALR